MAERFVPLVRDERVALLGLLNGFSGEDWQRPTICTPWSVRDAVAHLVENELLFGRLYRGELDHLGADAQEGVDRWSRVDGETVRYSLWHHGQATQRVMEGRSDDSWRRVVNQAGYSLELRQALRLHFFELAVHGHDVSSALGLPHVWGDRASVVVEYCLRAAPRALAASGLAPEGAIVVRVPEIGERTVAGSPDGWRVAAGAAEGSSALWETDAETLVLATTGRVAPSEALGRSRVEGDPGLLEGVVTAWQVTR